MSSTSQTKQTSKHPMQSHPNVCQQTIPPLFLLHQQLLNWGIWAIRRIRKRERSHLRSLQSRRTSAYFLHGWRRHVCRGCTSSRRSSATSSESPSARHRRASGSNGLEGVAQGLLPPDSPPPWVPRPRGSNRPGGSSVPVRRSKALFFLDAANYSCHVYLS